MSTAPGGGPADGPGNPAAAGAPVAVSDEALSKAEEFVEAEEGAANKLKGWLQVVVIGIAVEVTGLAASGAELLIQFIQPFGPLGALIVLYGVTLFATELLSNATVAVLVTPIAVALAESLGVDPRPFLVAVMMAASAASRVR